MQQHFPAGLKAFVLSSWETNQHELNATQQFVCSEQNASLVRHSPWMIQRDKYLSPFPVRENPGIGLKKAQRFCCVIVKLTKLVVDVGCGDVYMMTATDRGGQIGKLSQTCRWECLASLNGNDY